MEANAVQTKTDPQKGPVPHTVYLRYGADGLVVADPDRFKANVGDTITFKPEYKSAGTHQTRLTFPNGHQVIVKSPGGSYKVTVTKDLFDKITCETLVDGKWIPGSGTFPENGHGT
jgi:plastocyanin